MMIDQPATETVTAPEPLQPKSETVKRMLTRRSGATLPELAAATAWQAHSVRAYLSGLRKKGALLSREERRDGSKAYRLVRKTLSIESAE